MNLTEATKLLKSLADENRLKIIMRLLDKEEVCACKLLEELDCTQSTLSHHMKVLVDSGLVNTRKEWKRTYYMLNAKLLNSLSDFLHRKEEQ